MYCYGRVENIAPSAASLNRKIRHSWLLQLKIAIFEEVHIRSRMTFCAANEAHSRRAAALQHVELRGLSIRESRGPIETLAYRAKVAQKEKRHRDGSRLLPHVRLSRCADEVRQVLQPMGY